MTPLKLFLTDFADGCSKECTDNGYKAALLKGNVPCDILFVGETNGQSEGVLGRPFTGPAGKLLDQIILESGLSQFKLAFTTIVSCVKLEAESSSIRVKLTKEEIKKCSPRLIKTIALCKPKAIVGLGTVAHKELTMITRVQLLHLTHPGALLYAEQQAKDQAIKIMLIRLTELGEKLSTN